MQFGKASDRPPLRILVADADEITTATRGDEWAIAESNVHTNVQRPNLGKELYIPTRATPPSSSNRPGRRRLTETASGVTTLVIESLATCGWSIYPYLAGPAEHEMELQNPAAAPQFSLSAHDETNAPAASHHEGIVAVPAKPHLSASAAPSFRLSILRPLVKLWLIMRREQARRRAIAQSEALDDRTLKDIGIRRCAIVYVARHGNRHE
jgi:uncharacterized protein YjiS (DUF1127 family)